MTYAVSETSQASSAPVELYEFTYQGQTQLYTSYEEDILIGSTTYTSISIERSDVNETGEIGKENLKLTCPDQFPVSLLFEAGPPDDVVTLTIKRTQLATLDGSDIAIIWIGRISTVDWPPLRSEITCESVFTSLRAAGLHRIYSINCPFALYGTECKAIAADFQSTFALGVQTGNILTSPGFATQPDGWWAGGKVSWTNGALVVKRGIKSHTNDQVEITFAMPNIPNGVLITVLPGCDHTFYTCQTKFGQGDNYGGFPFMVQKNPWGSSSVF